MMRFSCKVARSRKTSGRADDQDEEKEIVTKNTMKKQHLNGVLKQISFML
jgi:hypothetical protein